MLFSLFSPNEGPVPLSDSEKREKMHDTHTFGMETIRSIIRVRIQVIQNFADFSDEKNSKASSDVALVVFN